MPSSTAEPVFALPLPLLRRAPAALAALIVAASVVSHWDQSSWPWHMVGLVVLSFQVYVTLMRPKLKLGHIGLIFLFPFPVHWFSYERMYTVERHEGILSKLGFANVRIRYAPPRWMFWLAMFPRLKYLYVRVADQDAEVFIAELRSRLPLQKG